MLAFSRQQVVEPTSLDLNAVVADIERMLHRLIGEDIALTFRPAPQLWPVLADRGQIEQVVVNLAVNARDAMPHGGQLTIETSNVELDEAFTRAHAGTRPGPHVLLTVTDTGAGMDAETQARIFEPFFTTKGQGQGHGAGPRHRLRRRRTGGRPHLGRERAGPRRDLHDLPAADGRHTRRRPRRSPDVDRTSIGGSETILIVEDDDAVRHVAATALRRLGYAVDVVSSAEAALQRLRDCIATPPTWC